VPLFNVCCQKLYDLDKENKFIDTRVKNIKKQLFSETFLISKYFFSETSWLSN